MRTGILFGLSFLLLLPSVGLGDSYSVDFILNKVRQKKLPEICAHMGVKYAKRTARGRQLREMYGPDWDHMHHFSWALVDLQRGKHGEAISNLDYILERSRRDFKFLPKVLVLKASILSINKNLLEALSVYNELVKLKPDLEEGWVGIVNILYLQGDVKGAKKVAKHALRYIPESNKLKTLIGN